MGNRVAVFEKLTKENLKKAIQEKCNVIIYNDFELEEAPDNFQLINAREFHHQGQWLVYQQNATNLRRAFKRFGLKSKLPPVDFFNGLKKLIFFTNDSLGNLEIALQKHTSSKDTIFFYKGSYVLSKLQYLIRIYWFYISDRLKGKQLVSRAGVIPNKIDGFKVGVYFKDDFEFQCYYDLLLIGAKKEGFVMIGKPGGTYSDKTRSLIEKLGAKFIKPSVHCVTEPYSGFPILKALKCARGELHALLHIMKNSREIQKEYAFALQLKALNLNALLVNEEENRYTGNLYSNVLKNSGTSIVNTMNGAKAGEPNDSDVDFDHWAIWDSEMKKMLIEKAGIPSEKLKIIGHLLEDNIRNHQFANSIQSKASDLENKKVISVFSVADNRQEKLDCLNLIRKKYLDNSEYMILFRPHPLEKNNPEILELSKHNNFVVIEYNFDNSKTTLYDQLLLTDLAIVFSSTIALEASWIGAPSVTLEYRKESILYFVDGKNIFHISSLTELDEKIDGVVLREDKFKPKEGAYPVTEKYINFLYSL